MARTPKFKPKQVAEAITGARGMLTIAARRLGCDYKTIRRYVDDYPEVKTALDEAHQSLGDSVELTLVSEALGQREVDANGNAIPNGKYVREPNITALIFIAKTRFKERGYSERTELTGKDGGAIEVDVSDAKAKLARLIDRQAATGSARGNTGVADE